MTRATPLLSASGSDTIDSRMMREAVRERMKALGWNLLKLSRESRVSYGRLYEWLDEKTTAIKSDSLEKVFKAMGMGVKMPPAKRKPARPKRRPAAPNRGTT